MVTFQCLEEKGYIRRDPTKPRAIEIVSDQTSDNINMEETIHVPVIGKVTKVFRSPQ